MVGIASALLYTNTAGNILAQPTFYMMKWQGIALSTFSLISEVNSNNQAIYDGALGRLGNGTNAFLNSHVNSIRRTDEYVEVCFSSSTRSTTEPITIRASQLVMAVPPKPETLGFLDLSPNGHGLLGQFNNSYLWNSVVLNSGAQTDSAIVNFDPKAALGIPAMPAAVVLAPSSNISNAREVEYGSAFPLEDQDVRARIFASTSTLQKAYKMTSPEGTRIKIAAFNNHSPYLFTVPIDGIKDGFYGKLNALQGQKRTWWTSSAFETEASSSIWNFTEFEILPRLMEVLD